MNRYVAQVRGRHAWVSGVTCWASSRPEARRALRQEWWGADVRQLRLDRPRQKIRGRWLERWWHAGWAADPNWIGRRKRRRSGY